MLWDLRSQSRGESINQVSLEYYCRDLSADKLYQRTADTYDEDWFAEEFR